MPEFVPARGFIEMEKLLKLYENQKDPIYIYLFGEKDKQGRSWCPDCVEGEYGGVPLQRGIHIFGTVGVCDIVAIKIYQLLFMIIYMKYFIFYYGLLIFFGKYFI